MVAAGYADFHPSRSSASRLPVGVYKRAEVGAQRSFRISESWCGVTPEPGAEDPKRQLSSNRRLGAQLAHVCAR